MQTKETEKEVKDKVIYTAREQEMLSCECGNEDHFIETVIATWEVDCHGERMLKIKEESKFCCPVCGQIIAPSQEKT